MIAAAGNLLIVEDDEEWCSAYVRAAVRENFQSIIVANDLGEAESLIDDVRFAVAIVDIGLNVKDDQNVDGIRVLAKIREVEDETSIVVVTGRTGRDVLPITRDAIMKYQAHEVMGKSYIEPSDLRRLLRSGRTLFDERALARKLDAHDMLRGHLPQWMWDDEMLRATRANHGILGFYEFLEELSSSFIPMVAREGEGAVRVDPATEVAHGGYWSRSTGQAIVICYGRSDRATDEVRHGAASGVLLDRYEVGSLLREFSANGVYGAVFGVRNENQHFRDWIAPLSAKPKPEHGSLAVPRAVKSRLPATVGQVW